MSGITPVLRMRTRNLARMMIRLETRARLALEGGKLAEAARCLDLRDAARQRRSMLLRRMWKEERSAKRYATSDKAVL